MVAITVVVPTYDRANLIGETLDAIFAQTLQALEIIVVDDGSTDRTPSVLAAYGTRIRSLRQENAGELAARNAGLNLAQGQFVAFCDSDDLWMPEFLARMAAQWQAQPDLTACYSDFRVLSNGNLADRSKFEKAPQGYWHGLRATGPDGGSFDGPRVAELIEFQPFFPSCMMVSTAAFRAIGGWDEGVSRIVGCDFATVLRVAAHPPIGVIRRPLVAIRKHAGNFSINTENMNLGDALVLEYVLRSRPELEPMRSWILTSVADRRTAALDSAFSRRDFSTVRQIYALLHRESAPARSRLKAMLASLPPPLNALLADLISGRTMPASGPS